MTNQAFIYDAIQIPQSRGKKEDSLHEFKPIELGAGLLRELQSRHQLDTAYVRCNAGLLRSSGRSGRRCGPGVGQRAVLDDPFGVALFQGGPAQGTANRFIRYHCYRRPDSGRDYGESRCQRGHSRIHREAKTGIFRSLVLGFVTDNYHREFKQAM